MRILLVDDESDIRILTSLLLKHRGHVVETASNGAEAVEMATRRPPDAVLLDLNMPVMDGFTAARKMRELASMQSVLIVAVSAYVGEKAWCDRALAAGVDECVPKPMDYNKLESLLREGRLSNTG